jgi:hypothetical protein
MRSPILFRNASDETEYFEQHGLRFAELRNLAQKPINSWIRKRHRPGSNVLVTERQADSVTPTEII